MSKRIITLGTWEGKPIEWVVLSEDEFSTLVISRYEIARRCFNNNSSNNNWGSSDLRKFLKNEFYKSAFTEDEKKKIVNVKLTDANNAKDNVFILSESEVKSLLLKDGDDDYERNHYNNNNYRCWTRTKDVFGVRVGYAKGGWCSSYANTTLAVRPAMWIKE